MEEKVIHRFETDEQLLARAKDYCVVCTIKFVGEPEAKTIRRMRERGNWCLECNKKASLGAMIGD